MPPKHILHMIRDNDLRLYEQISETLFTRWEDESNSGRIEERVTDFHEALLYDLRTNVHQVLVANETEAQWKAMTEDEQFNTCDIVVKDFLVELAHTFEQYRPKT